jgi:hypothetical protein
MNPSKIFFLIISILFLAVLAQNQDLQPLKVAKVYFLPDFLQGRITDEWYNRWLTRKAKYIIAQDREKHRPCARNATAQQYKELIHAAVQNGGRLDPFTGGTLQWELVCTWDDTKDGAPPTGVGGSRKFFLLNEQKETMATPRSRRHIDPQAKSGAFCVVGKNPDPGMMKRYSLLPTVDHVDPYADTPAFEICSWLINRCKNNLTSQEFIALANKIMEYRKSKQPPVSEGPTKIVYGSPQKYFLPDFLSGIITEQQYIKWLGRKARHIYYADVEAKRPCAANSSAKQYKELINAAIHATGKIDPFTGDTMSWTLVGTWDDSKQKDPDEETVKKFGMMPTVDHVDPEGKTAGFEICSWLVNRCKANQTPDEFLALCERIVAFNNLKTTGK